MPIDHDIGDETEDDNAPAIEFNPRAIDRLVSKWKHIALTTIAAGSIGIGYIGTDAVFGFVRAVIPVDQKEVDCCVKARRVLDRCGEVVPPPGDILTEPQTCCEVQSYIGLSCQKWKPEQ